MTFRCTFRNGTPQDFSSVYSCYITSITDINAGPNVTAVSGTHAAGKTNADVLYVEIVGVRTLQFIPKGIEAFFPNLIALEATNCNITTLYGDELQPFQNITNLRLTGNPNLEWLPGNLFANKYQMKVICLNTNNIKRVGVGLLDHLEYLTHTDFWRNYCVSLSIARNDESFWYLVNHLKNNCTDIAPKCSDFNKMICDLQQQNQDFKAENSETISLVDDIAIILSDLTAQNDRIKSLLNETISMVENLPNCALNSNLQENYNTEK